MLQLLPGKLGMLFLSERDVEKPSERGPKKLYGALVLMSKDTGDQVCSDPLLSLLMGALEGIQSHCTRKLPH